MAVYGNGLYGAGLYGAGITVSAALDSAFPPRMIVDAAGLAIGDVVTIYRVQMGVRTPLRGAIGVTMTDTAIIDFDGEYSFGVPTTYVVNENGFDAVTSSPVTPALPGGKAVLSDAITGLSVECLITAWPDKTTSRGSAKYNVGGRTVVVSPPRGGFESSVEFMTESETTREQMALLLDGATAGIILVRAPDVSLYPGFDYHLAVLSDDERIYLQNGQDVRRLWTLDVVSTDGWAPALETSGSTYAMVISVFAGARYLDLQLDFATYEDLDSFDWPSVV